MTVKGIHLQTRCCFYDYERTAVNTLKTSCVYRNKSRYCYYQTTPRTMTHFVIVHRFHDHGVRARFERAVTRKYPQHQSRKIDKYHYLAFQAPDEAHVAATLHQIVGDLPTDPRDYAIRYFSGSDAPDQVTRVVEVGADQGYRGTGVKNAHDRCLVDLLEINFEQALGQLAR